MRDNGGNGLGAHPHLNGLSLPELLKLLVRETSMLLRREAELARTEIDEKIFYLRDEARYRSELGRDAAAQATRMIGDEAGRNGRKAGVGIGILAGGALVGVLAAAVFTAFLVLALEEGMPAWAAALVVTAVYAALAAALVTAGRRAVRRAMPIVSRRTFDAVWTSFVNVMTPDEALKRAASPVPEQTVETLKEDIEWVKALNKSEAR